MAKGETLRVETPQFSSAERDRRWALARRFMDREGLDALLVFGEHEDAGPAPFCFDAWFTNDRSGTTVLFALSGQPTVFAPISTYLIDHLEATRRGDGSWVVAEDFRLGHRSTEIVEEVNARGLTRGVIGVIGLEPYIPWHPEGIVPFTLWRNVEASLPDVTFRPVALSFAREMMPLSAEEVAVVKRSAAIGDAMARAMVEAAKPGVSEAALYAAGMAEAHRHGTVAPGMHFWTGPAPAASGPPQWAYRAQPPRILEEGDFIATEVFCNFAMRQTQHQVAITLGAVHPEIERAARIARECYEAGLGTLRAGVRFGDIAEAMLKPVEAVGGWVRGPQIHGLNPYGALSRIPPGRSQVPGAERYPDFFGMDTALADMELQAGMSFAFEPSCGFGRHLVTLGGTLIVGESGAIELNAYSANLLRAGA